VAPKFSGLEAIASSWTAEALSVDSENLSFDELQTEYKAGSPNLISRRRYRGRRKSLFDLAEKIRKAAARVKMTNTGNSAELFSQIQQVVPLSRTQDVDILIYGALCFLKDFWKEDEIETLIAIVSAEQAREYIRKALPKS
jgi:hypothetical protein